MTMQRRAFLQRAVPGAVAAGVLAGCGQPAAEGPAVVTQPHIDWRMASSFPRSLDTLFGSAERFCKRVAGLTGGRFRIRPYPAGELVPGLQVMDAVQQGTVACGQTAGYYYTGKHPALAFETTVPFGLTVRQQFAWLTQAGGLELLNNVLADFNIRSFCAGATGAQMGGWFRRDVPSLASLRGLKMRIPGLGGEIMSRLGATVQVLAGSDIYLALERGAIDATEWVGPHDDEKLGLHKITSNYYYPGWWEPGASIAHYVNRAAWDKLPADYQAAFEVASNEACLWMISAYDRLNPPALQRMLAAGVTLRRFSDDLLAEAEKTATALMQERAAAEPAYRAIHEHWQAFRGESFRWFGTAELAYAEFAFRRG